jgi:hypothetical protein
MNNSLDEMVEEEEDIDENVRSFAEQATWDCASRLMRSFEAFHPSTLLLVSLITLF